MGIQIKKIVNFKAKLIAGSVNCSAVIENLSEDSLYMQAVPVKSVTDFTPGEMVEVKFEPIEGEPICLSCKVQWSYRTPPHGLTNSLGIEIIKPHPTYDELLKGLA